MRTPLASLVLVTALATLPGCGHPAAPAAANAAFAGSLHAAADADRDLAEQRIRAQFQGEGGQVSQVELYATARPRAFSYACYYSRPEAGQTCLYTVRGQVDLDAGGLTAHRHLDLCLGPLPTAM